MSASRPVAASGAPTGGVPYVDPQRAVRERRTMGPGFGPGLARELLIDEATFTGRPSVIGRRHKVSAVLYLATMGGLRILMAGGNAIDEGGAAGLCINAVEPQLAVFGGVAPIMIAPAGGEPVAISGLGR